MVQQQVESFNTIISEEAAGAAAHPADISGSKQESGEVVVRHGAGFRVVRPAGVPDPHADAAAADGKSSSTAGATAAAAAPAAAGAAGSAEQQQQKLALLQQDFASKLKVSIRGSLLTGSTARDCKRCYSSMCARQIWGSARVHYPDMLLSLLSTRVHFSR